VNERKYWQTAAAALSGRRAACDVPAAERDAFVRWTSTEGLAGLLVSTSPDGNQPAGIREAIFDVARRQAARAAHQDHELQRVLSELAEAGLSTVLLKGAALAYTVYPEPSLRPRSDTDLLIRETDAPQVMAAFERLEYKRQPEVGGQLVTSQFSYGRADRRGLWHLLDVHLKIVNALAYADRLSFEDLRAEAAPLPALHPHAFAPSPVHSLLVACLHRVAHHYDTERLVWLLDVHLLARSLGEQDWQRVVALAEARQLAGIVLRGLERAQQALGDCAPDRILQQLRDGTAAEGEQPLLDGVTRQIDVLISDLSALESRRARLQLLREHLFPSTAYMRQAYARCPPALLPLAYAYRIVRGAPKWFKNRRDSENS